MKRIILCADDYGQNTAISQAIIELMGQNCLSATSCMTTSPHWLAHANWLQPLKDKVDIGLHFNLTEGRLLSNNGQIMSLSQLMVKSHLRQLNQEKIEGELNLQLDQFIAGIGREPAFIDGHQHVHQFPVIRNALLKVYQQRLQKTGCYIRSVFVSHFLQGEAIVKKSILQFSGARSLKQDLINSSIPHNTSFSGIYDFSKAAHYKALFPQFLTEIENAGLIMCHPGLSLEAKDITEKDAIASARVYEYSYFKSREFKQDCAKAEVQLGRFKE
jgi:predicted glycoside hydrolase/deacetylase ChbG (UPF0249 family)